MADWSKTRRRLRLLPSSVEIVDGQIQAASDEDVYRKCCRTEQSRLVQYKMSLKGGVIPTQDEPGGNLGKVD